MKKAIFAALVSFVLAQPASANSSLTQTALAGDQQELDEARRIYDLAGAPELDGDRKARLAIYKRAFAKLDSITPNFATSKRYKIDTPFYKMSIAIHLADNSLDSKVQSAVDELLPEIRSVLATYPESGELKLALTQGLRIKTQQATIQNRYKDALPTAREGGKLIAELSERSPNDRFIKRALAIDLDNLANIEAKLGNSEKANIASQQALIYFRELAQAQPNSRPAQGSLLISLVRRGMNNGEPELIDEAEQLGKTMRERGILVGRYAELLKNIGAIRKSAEVAEKRLAAD